MVVADRIHFAERNACTLCEELSLALLDCSNPLLFCELALVAFAKRRKTAQLHYSDAVPLLASRHSFTVGTDRPALQRSA